MDNSKILDVIESGGKLDISDTIYSKFNLIYNSDVIVIYEFDDVGYDLVLLSSDNYNITEILNKMNELSEFKVLYLELHEFSVYIEGDNRPVDVMLSKSLRSYGGEGVYIMGNGTITFENLRDAVNPEILSRMIVPLCELILLRTTEDSDSIINNVHYERCIVRMPSGYKENNYAINFKVSYMAMCPYQDGNPSIPTSL